jgi:hypothetical protein
MFNHGSELLFFVRSARRKRSKEQMVAFLTGPYGALLINGPIVAVKNVPAYG